MVIPTRGTSTNPGKPINSFILVKYLSKINIIEHTFMEHLLRSRPYINIGQSNIKCVLVSGTIQNLFQKRPKQLFRMSKRKAS